MPSICSSLKDTYKYVDQGESEHLLVANSAEITPMDHSNNKILQSSKN